MKPRFFNIVYKIYRGFDVLSRRNYLRMLESYKWEINYDLDCPMLALKIKIYLYIYIYTQQI